MTSTDRMPLLVSAYTFQMDTIATTSTFTRHLASSLKWNFLLSFEGLSGRLSFLQVNNVRVPTGIVLQLSTCKKPAITKLARQISGHYDNSTYYAEGSIEMMDSLGLNMYHPVFNICVSSILVIEYL